MARLAKALKQLPAVIDGNQLPAEPPPLENEPPHRRLARATAEQSRCTEALRELKRSFAAKNLQAQLTRTPISTAEQTHVARQRHELHLQLESAQAQIAAANKEIREKKATAQTGAKPKEPKLRDVKKAPFRQDREFVEFFYLAAEATLTEPLFATIIRTAKSMMFDAAKMGLRQGDTHD
jgi:hypothetical protein